MSDIQRRIAAMTDEERAAFEERKRKLMALCVPIEATPEILATARVLTAQWEFEDKMTEHLPTATDVVAEGPRTQGGPGRFPSA